jgi:ribosome-associated translation inhibitor RaiA
MQIQFNTDKNVHGEASLAAWAEHELRERLHRFGEQITRIEVHLSDNNAARLSEQDMRCKLEARLAGRDPMVVSHDAAKVADALHGAAEKLARALDTTLGKARDANGRDTIRGD